MALVGLGTFAMAQQTPTSKMEMKRGDKKQNMEMRQQKHLDQMKSELNLSDDQVMKIKAMHQENAADRKNKMAQNKEEKMQHLKNQKDEMKKILTPEQYTKWEGNMKEKMGKMKGKKMMKRNQNQKSKAE